ncbi:unnamed protein product, partial [Didymodactylos carnosus]
GQKAWNDIKKKGQETIQAEISQTSIKVKSSQSLLSPVHSLWAKKKNIGLTTPLLSSSSSSPSSSSSSQSTTTTTTAASPSPVLTTSSEPSSSSSATNSTTNRG